MSKSIGRCRESDFDGVMLQEGTGMTHLKVAGT